jgi:hypothetical protein
MRLGARAATANDARAAVPAKEAQEVYNFLNGLGSGVQEFSSKTTSIEPTQGTRRNNQGRIE